MPIDAALDNVTQDVPPPADAAADRVTGMDALELGPKTGKGALGRRIWRSAWPKLLAIALVVLIWQLVVLAEWKPEYVLPGPLAVFDDLKSLIVTGDFWDGVRLTMTRAVTGFALAVAIGTVIGAAVSRFAPLRAAIGSLITGLQTMPSIMWFPLAILLFQISESAIMFVVVIGAAPSVANGLISGIDYVPRTWLRVGLRQVPAPDPAGLAAVVHLRAQAGLGVLLAQPDGRRAAGDRAGCAVHRRTHAERPRPQRGQPGDLLHHRGADHRHPDRRAVQRGRQRAAQALGPDRQVTLTSGGPTA
jgi:hypothetical protein